MVEPVNSVRENVRSATSSHYLPRTLPPGLEALSDLTLDMRWSWNHAADELRERVDPELWEATGNPWLILQSVSLPRLEELARDPAFMTELQRLQESRELCLPKTLSGMTRARPYGNGSGRWSRF